MAERTGPRARVSRAALARVVWAVPAVGALVLGGTVSAGHGAAGVAVVLMVCGMLACLGVLAAVSRLVGAVRDGRAPRPVRAPRGFAVRPGTLAGGGPRWDGPGAVAPAPPVAPARVRTAMIGTVGALAAVVAVTVVAPILAPLSMPRGWPSEAATVAGWTAAILILPVLLVFAAVRGAVEPEEPAFDDVWTYQVGSAAVLAFANLGEPHGGGVLTRDGRRIGRLTRTDDGHPEWLVTVRDPARPARGRALRLGLTTSAVPTLTVHEVTAGLERTAAVAEAHTGAPDTGGPDTTGRRTLADWTLRVDGHVARLRARTRPRDAGGRALVARRTLLTADGRAWLTRRQPCAHRARIPDDLSDVGAACWLVFLLLLDGLIERPAVLDRAAVTVPATPADDGAPDALDAVLSAACERLRPPPEN